MKTRSYFEQFLHLTNPRTLKEDVEIDVKEPVENDIEAADGAVVAPIIDPEMGYDTGDMDDTQVEQDGSAYIGKSVVDCHVCNNAFFIDGMEIPEELVCPVCAAPAADLELVGIVEPIPEEEPATTDNSDEQDNDSDDDSDDEDSDEQDGDYESEGSDEDGVEESAGKASFYKKAKMTEGNKHISKLAEGYENLTVRELTTILQDALDILSDYDDEDVVVTEPSIYGLYGNFIAIRGRGYVELNNINIEGYGDYQDMDESLKKLKENDSKESYTEQFLYAFEYFWEYDVEYIIEFLRDYLSNKRRAQFAREYIGIPGSKLIDIVEQQLWHTYDVQGFLDQLVDFGIEKEAEKMLKDYELDRDSINRRFPDDEDEDIEESVKQSVKKLKEENSVADRFEYEIVQGSGRNRYINTYHSSVYTPDEKNSDMVFIDILRTHLGTSDEQLERMQNSEGGFKGYLSRRKFNPSSSAPIILSVKDLQNGNFIFKHPQYEEIKEVVPMDESLKKPKAFPQVKKAQRASGVVKTTAKANINKGKSVAESRRAMSKKIKDIYESRRAAQSTQVKKKSDLTNEAINPENAEDNAVLKKIMLGRGNKKLSAKEQAVLDKYGFVASDKGGSKLITNPATQNTIYLNTTRNTYDLYLVNKERHREIGSFDKDSRDPKGLNAVDLISFLNSESEPRRDYTTKASKLNRDTGTVSQADIRYYQKAVDKLEKMLKDAIDSNAYPDYIQTLQAKLDRYKKYLRKLQQDKGYVDKDAFAYRRYMDDTVNDNIKAYKKLKRDLLRSQDRLDSAKNNIAVSTSKWTIKQLQDQIAELQKQLDRALSGVGDEEDEERAQEFEKQTQEIRAKIDNLFANVKRSTGKRVSGGETATESRQAMSKKIKDIYENRRAAQNTQVKKKSDLTNEAINPENAEDNAVLKNIMLGRGNKKLSAQEQAVLDKYGFIARANGGSKSIENPSTGNSVYLETGRDYYNLVVTNDKKGGRRYIGDIGGFDKDSTDPKGLNAFDIINFLNSDSDLVWDRYKSKTGKYNRGNEYIRAHYGSDIRRYKKYIRELQTQIDAAVASNADPDYIQRLQQNIAAYKKALQELQVKAGLADKDDFAQRRYSDDAVNNTIQKYKQLKKRLDDLDYDLNRARGNIAKSTSEITIKQLQDQIAKLQKQLDRALSNTGTEWDERRAAELEKETQEVRAQISDLIANAKRRADSNN